MGLCNRCHQAAAAEGDTWCLACAGHEALGRELCAVWPPGARKVVEDLVISCTRQVRALRNFGQAVRNNALAAQSSGRKKEVEGTSRQGDRPELKRRKPDEVDSKHLGAEPKRLREAPPPEDSESGVFEEESEEEYPETSLAPLAGKDRRRPPEPDGPPPHIRKQGEGRGDRREKAADQKHRRPGGHSGSQRTTKPRHRAGRKHQRLGRLEQDPTTPIHRKLSSHYLDTLSVDKGQDSLSRLP